MTALSLNRGLGIFVRLFCGAGDRTFEPRALPMLGTLSTPELQIQPQVILLNVSAGSFLHSKFRSLELPVIQFG